MRSNGQLRTNQRKTGKDDADSLRSVFQPRNRVASQLPLGGVDWRSTRRHDVFEPAKYDCRSLRHAGTREIGQWQFVVDPGYP